MSDPHLVTGGRQLRLPLLEPTFWSRKTDTEKQALQQSQAPQQSGGGRKWCEMNSEVGRGQEGRAFRPSKEFGFYFRSFGETVGGFLTRKR